MVCFLGFGLGLGLLSSCQGETAPPATETPSTKAPKATKELKWNLPDGWSIGTVPEDNTTRDRQFQIGQGEQQLDVLVYHWSGGVGGLQSNLTRWESSLGLQEEDPKPAIESLDGEGLVTTLFNGKGTYSSMSGSTIEEARLLNAYIESPAGRFAGVYTDQLVGPSALVDAQVDAFRTMIQGL